MVIKPKHVGSVLMQILIFSCASVGNKTLIRYKVCCLKKTEGGQYGRYNTELF